MTLPQKCSICSVKNLIDSVFNTKLSQMTVAVCLLPKTDWFALWSITCWIRIRLWRPGRLNAWGAILPSPTKLLEFCWQKADRFCVSASCKLQPGNEQLTTRQRLAGWQRARLMKWIHYYELIQTESLIRGYTWIWLSPCPSSSPGEL